MELILPLPQYAFMAYFSVKKKHRDNFTFTMAFRFLRFLAEAGNFSLHHCV
jgi:hypothetical protein